MELSLHMHPGVGLLMVGDIGGLYHWGRLWVLVGTLMAVGD